MEAVKNNVQIFEGLKNSNSVVNTFLVIKTQDYNFKLYHLQKYVTSQLNKFITGTMNSNIQYPNTKFRNSILLSKCYKRSYIGFITNSSYLDILLLLYLTSCLQSYFAKTLFP
jgi:hypothetical protein